MKSTKTIDEKHSEFVSKFIKNKLERVPKLRAEIINLNIELKTFKNNIDKYMDTKDNIRNKKQEITSLLREEKDYYLDNSKYIFNYFEQKKDISSGGGNTNVLHSFFKIKSIEQEVSNPLSERYNKSRKTYQNYWRNVTNDFINIQDYIVSSDFCEICNSGEMIPQDEEGILICNNPLCGKFISYIIDSSKPTNKEPPNEVSYTAYIRLNHFKEILSQFQAKETTQIPEHIIQAIKDRIKKERIKDYKEITYDKMRDILRKLGLNKYFEHIQYINSIFGVKPPIMSEELHETLCVLFIEIQQPWAIHCPPNRRNFFNYTYTLFQLCVLLDQTQYLPYIPMMKDREKQLDQDMIWKKVCMELDWEFFATV
jgi:hypothetical protein